MCGEDKYITLKVQQKWEQKDNRKNNKDKRHASKWLEHESMLSIIWWIVSLNKKIMYIVYMGYTVF